MMNIVNHDRSLSYLDWHTLADVLAQRCSPLLTAGGDHLLTWHTLRTETIHALITQGVAPHELTMDARNPAGRCHLSVLLDTGIHTTIELTHLNHDATTRTHSRAIATALHRITVIPAHEHITITVALPGEAQRLGTLEKWPLKPGQEATLPGEAVRGSAEQRDLEVTCLAHAQAGNHSLLVWSATQSLPVIQPINPQPHLFALPIERIQEVGLRN